MFLRVHKLLCGSRVKVAISLFVIISMVVCISVVFFANYHTTPQEDAFGEYGEGGDDTYLSCCRGTTGMQSPRILLWPTPHELHLSPSSQNTSQIQELHAKMRPFRHYLHLDSITADSHYFHVHDASHSYRVALRVDTNELIQSPMEGPEQGMSLAVHSASTTNTHMDTTNTNTTTINTTTNTQHDEDIVKRLLRNVAASLNTHVSNVIYEGRFVGARVVEELQYNITHHNNTLVQYGIAWLRFDTHEALPSFKLLATSLYESGTTMSCVTNTAAKVCQMMGESIEYAPDRVDGARLALQDILHNTQLQDIIKTHVHTHMRETYTPYTTTYTALRERSFNGVLATHTHEPLPTELGNDLELMLLVFDRAKQSNNQQKLHFQCSFKEIVFNNALFNATQHIITTRGTFDLRVLISGGEFSTVNIKNGFASASFDTTFEFTTSSNNILWTTTKNTQLLASINEIHTQITPIEQKYYPSYVAHFDVENVDVYARFGMRN